MIRCVICLYKGKIFNIIGFNLKIDFERNLTELNIFNYDKNITEKINLVKDKNPIFRYETDNIIFEVAYEGINPHE